MSSSCLQRFSRKTPTYIFVMREQCFSKKTVKLMLLLPCLTILKLLFALSLAVLTVEKVPNTKLGNFVAAVTCSFNI